MSILDTIDGALRDCEVSSDAMRWTPSPPSASPEPGGVIFELPNGYRPARAWQPVDIALSIDTSQFEAAFRQIGEAVSRFARSCAEAVKSMAPIVEAVNGARAERVSAMHREYRRRSSARRRRRR